jgi:hypothetical protein
MTDKPSSYLAAALAPYMTVNMPLAPPPSPKPIPLPPRPAWADAPSPPAANRVEDRNDQCGRLQALIEIAEGCSAASQRVLPPNVMADCDWSAATPALREAELLALSQSTIRNALQLGLFESPQTRGEINHNRQLLGLAANVAGRHAVKPIQRDPSIAAEDALRLQAARGLVSLAAGRVTAGEVSDLIDQANDAGRRANAIEKHRRGVASPITTTAAPSLIT